MTLIGVNVQGGYCSSLSLACLVVSPVTASFAQTRKGFRDVQKHLRMTIFGCIPVPLLLNSKTCCIYPLPENKQIIITLAWSIYGNILWEVNGNQLSKFVEFSASATNLEQIKWKDCQVDFVGHLILAEKQGEVRGRKLNLWWLVFGYKIS